MSEEVLESDSEEAVRNSVDSDRNAIPDEEQSETGHDETPEEKPEKNGKRRRILKIGAAVVVLGIIAGVAYWLYARRFESTDDAFIDGDIVQVSPRVSAYVSRVAVDSNQFVHKGDLLVELNDSDLQVKLEQAKAALETAKSQRGLARANADLTAKTAVAGQTTARSNVQTAQSNVRQTSLAADAKQSQIAQARAAARTAQANLAQTQAQVPQAESNLRLAQVERDRRQELFNRGDISRQSLDQAINAFQTTHSQLDAAQKAVLAARSRVEEAEANVRTAENNYQQSVAQIDLTRSQVGESRGRLMDASAAPERVEVSESQVTTAEAGILAAEAAVRQAELELSYSKIYAPEDGYVTRKNVEEGQLVQVGAPLMAISQSDEVWVVANFKETQLENMQIGQPVDIKVDAFPSESFHGKVESFQAGTGSKFSVLPAENATGNYVKVVQRVPVKIVFDDPPEKIKRLVPGMSVEPSVTVR